MKCATGSLLFVLILCAAAASVQGRDQEAVLPAWRPASDDTSLIVVHADVPRYPALAVAARLSGTVRVRISVKGGEVRSAETESRVAPVLLHAARDNVLTWRFAPDVYGAMEVTYVYALAEAEAVVAQNPHIEMQLPNLVKITAKPVKPVSMHGQSSATREPRP